MNNNNQIKVGDKVEVIECKECPRSHGEAIIITIYPRYYCVKLTKDKCLNTSHCHALIVESVSPIKKKKPKKKTDYKPNYAVHPIETLKECAIYQDLGSEWVQRLEVNGITEKDAMLLSALYRVPKQFLLNLQKNYEEITDRLNKEKDH